MHTPTSGKIQEMQRFLALLLWKFRTVENWPDFYKPGQAKVYPVGLQDKAVIDRQFDKLHEQGKME